MKSIAQNSTEPGTFPYFKKLVGGLSFLTFLWLILFCIVNKREMFDGFDYLISAMHYWGDRTEFNPKNPLITLLLGLLYGPFHALEIQPPLFAFRLPLLCLYFLMPYWLCRVVLSLGKPSTEGTLPWILAGVLIWNRFGLFWTQFALPDMLAGLCIAGWIHTEFFTPITSGKGRLLRAFFLGAGALARIHIGILPGAYYLLNLVFFREIPLTRRILFLIQIGVLALSLFTLGNLIHFKVAYAFGLKKALVEAYRFHFGYLKLVRSTVEPGSVYLLFMQESFSRFGILLAFFGLFPLIRYRISGKLLHLAIAAAFFFLLLCGKGHKEDRYLTPILPVIALLQALAVVYLMRLGKQIRLPLGECAAFLLFLNFTPLLHSYIDPNYRAPHDEIFAKTVTQNLTDGKISLYPTVSRISISKQNKDRENPNLLKFFPNFETSFTVQASSLQFYRKFNVTFPTKDLKFSDGEFPLARNLNNLVAPGQRVLVTTRVFDAQVEMPGYLVSWWKRGSEPAGTHCDPRLKEYCQEIKLATP